MSRLFVGLETPFVQDLPATLNKVRFARISSRIVQWVLVTHYRRLQVHEEKMNGVAAPLFHPRY